MSTTTAKKPQAAAKKAVSAGDKKDLIKIGTKECWKPDDSIARLIPLDRIVTNSSNPRRAAPNLYELGYGLFDLHPESNKPHCLRQMALSESPELRAQFIELIEKHEGVFLKGEEADGGAEVTLGIPRLADSIIVQGWINPVRVRPINKGKHAGDYDLIVGGRRYLAMLYISVKRQQVYPVKAFVDSDEDGAAKSKALDENITVQPMRPSEIIVAMKRELSLGLNESQIAAKFGTNERTVERRLCAAEAGEDLLNKLDKGEVGITDVENIGRGVKNGKDRDKLIGEILGRPSRRQNKTPGGKATAPVSMSVKTALKILTSDDKAHEQYRMGLCAYFHIEYKTFDQMKIEAEADAK